jgi:hypothetical protein
MLKDFVFFATVLTVLRKKLEVVEISSTMHPTKLLKQQCHLFI